MQTHEKQILLMLQRLRGDEEGISLLPSQSLGNLGCAAGVNSSLQGSKMYTACCGCAEAGTENWNIGKAIWGQGQRSLEENILE